MGRPIVRGLEDAEDYILEPQPPKRMRNISPYVDTSAENISVNLSIDLAKLWLDTATF